MIQDGKGWNRHKNCTVVQTLGGKRAQARKYGISLATSWVYFDNGTWIDKLYKG